MLRTGRSKNVQAMELLRELFGCNSLYNIELQVSYINTKDNVVADLLSRIRCPVTEATIFGMTLMFNLCCINRVTPRPEG